MHIKITTAAGVATYIEGEIQVVVSAAGRITDITYGVTPTVVAAIAAYNGTNTRYEYGELNDCGFFNKIFSN